MRKLLRIVFFAQVLCLPFVLQAQEVSCYVNEDVSVYLPKHKSSPINSKTRKTKPFSHAANINQIMDVYPARVIALKGEAYLIERSGQVLLEPQRLSVGQSLYLNDVVETKANSFLSLKLGDETQNVLPSNAQVQLKQANPKVARLVLIKGGVESRVIKNSNAKKNTFEIQLPTVSVGVRGTHFRVSQDKNVGRVEVENGSVWIASRQLCKASIVVQSKQGVIINGQNIEAAVPLLDAPTLIAAEVAQRQFNKISFEINPVVGAKRYRTQIARDYLFVDIQKDLIGDSTVIEFNGDELSDGFYYLRVSAISSQGLEGMSQSYLFLRNQELPQEGL